MGQNTIAAPKAECKKDFRSKLPDREIDLIRELAESGMSYQEIEARFA